MRTSVFIPQEGSATASRQVVAASGPWPHNKKRRLEEEEEYENVGQPPQKRSPPPPPRTSTSEALIQSLANTIGEIHAMLLPPSADLESRIIAAFLVHSLYYPNPHRGIKIGKHGLALLDALCEKSGVSYNSVMNDQGDVGPQFDIVHNILNKLIFQHKFAIGINTAEFPGKRLFFNLVALRCLMVSVEEEECSEYYEDGFSLDFKLVREISSELKALKGISENNLARWLTEGSKRETQSDDDAHVVEFLSKECGPFFASAYSFAVRGYLRGCDTIKEAVFEAIFEEVYGCLMKSEE